MIPINTSALKEAFPPFSSTPLLVSYNSIILSAYHWHDLRLKKKHNAADRKIHHAYKKDETQKPKLYEAADMNISCKYINTVLL